MKRLLIHIAIFTGLGCLTSYIVAWVIAGRVEYPRWEESLCQTHFVAAGNSWYLNRKWGFGSSRNHWIFDGPLVPVEFAEEINADLGEETPWPPEWGMLNRLPTRGLIEGQSQWLEDARGWPMLCVYCTFEPPFDITSGVKGGFSIAEPRDAVFTNEDDEFEFRGPRALPCQPIWSGLLLNSLIYGAALWRLWHLVRGGDRTRVVRDRIGLTKATLALVVTAAVAANWAVASIYCLGSDRTALIGRPEAYRTGHYDYLVESRMWSAEPASPPSRLARAHARHMPGNTRTWWSIQVPTNFGFLSGFTDVQNLDSETPRWVDAFLPDEKLATLERLKREQIVEAAGWPFLAFCGGVEVDESSQTVKPEWSILPWGPRPGDDLDDVRLVPLWPVWGGLLFNVILYSWVFWIVISSLWWVRRIVRQHFGRCVHCGYDLRGRTASSRACPECGSAAR